jgi:hypothetical protein
LWRVRPSVGLVRLGLRFPVVFAARSRAVSPSVVGVPSCLCLPVLIAGWCCGRPARIWRPCVALVLCVVPLRGAFSPFFLRVAPAPSPGGSSRSPRPWPRSPVCAPVVVPRVSLQPFPLHGAAGINKKVNKYEKYKSVIVGPFGSFVHNSAANPNQSGGPPSLRSSPADSRIGGGPASDVRSQARFTLGAWSLVILWSLVLGPWNFRPQGSGSGSIPAASFVQVLLPVHCRATSLRSRRLSPRKRHRCVTH